MERESSDRVAWTSRLDASGAALSHRLNHVPLGMVTGTAVTWYGLSNQWFRAMRSGEVEPLRRIFRQARESALDHLREEAQRLGADAVTGIEVVLKERTWGRSLLEVSFRGTAVRLAAESRGDLVLTHLAPAEMAVLDTIGTRPAAMVMTRVVYRHEISAKARYAEGSLRSQEIPEFSHAARAAWRVAMEDLARQAEAADADGLLLKPERLRVVERTLPHGDNSGTYFDDLLFSMTLIGTAVTGSRRVRPSAVVPTLSLDDNTDLTIRSSPVPAPRLSLLRMWPHRHR